jgi:molybdopterin synthase catalytic subunit
VTLRIRLFASLADRAGTAELSLELPEGLTAGELWEQVAAAVPGLASAGRPLVAVNLEYAAPDRVLREDDAIALLPPVSGG